eukprot:TRINITY_DN702_c0_g1_i1.p1 TRINITY_DN702_c0_g1~~TRINITY_DN702_c0_g1_i1.p1  ORF type:complete len:298 (-),score=51.27 TRINITY_DN702_c0_g1_i1:993-1886(-)
MTGLCGKARRPRSEPTETHARCGHETTGHDNRSVRRTRAASKRAMDESRAGAVGGNRKKRIALTNLSNQADVAVRSSCHPLKAESCGHDETSNVVKDRLLEEVGPESEGAESLPAESDLKNLQGDSAAMASLEKRTEQNLRISQDPLPTDIEVESSGWSSCFGYLDIDADMSDSQMCSEYVKDIYAFLRKVENERRPATDFMENLQQDINSNMRGILVDWLVEVAEEYKLVPDTLYLTVSYIDRFLTTTVVTRSRLQLLGVSCMLIAAKYEEIYAPQVEEFCYITDNTYRREEVTWD